MARKKLHQRRSTHIRQTTRRKKRRAEGKVHVGLRYQEKSKELFSCSVLLFLCFWQAHNNKNKKNVDNGELEGTRAQTIQQSSPNNNNNKKRTRGRGAERRDKHSLLIPLAPEPVVPGAILHHMVKMP